MNGRAGVVLAGGIGSRMRSKLPKVLHKLCGREMLLYPVETLRQAGVEYVVVVVSPSNEESVRSLLGDSVEYVVQHQPLGTGHALLQTASVLRDRADHLAVIGGGHSFGAPQQPEIPPRCPSFSQGIHVHHRLLCRHAYGHGTLGTKT